MGKGKRTFQNKLTSSRIVGAFVVGLPVGRSVGDCDGPVGRGVVGRLVGFKVTTGDDVGLAVGSAVKS